MSRIESVEIPVGSSALTESSTRLRPLKPRLNPVALALVNFLVLLPAILNRFLELDDQVKLEQNPDYRGLTWPHHQWMFKTVPNGELIPLTWLTFGLDYVFWGMN